MKNKINIYKIELLAALYDEKNSRPQYEFLKGTIGKSYAFETALNYQIPPFLVEKARKNYGEDKQNLEELVSKNINLELELRTKLKELQFKENKVDTLLNSFKIQKEKEEPPPPKKNHKPTSKNSQLIFHSLRLKFFKH